MFDALEGIVDFVVSVGEFILNRIQSIIWLISSIPQFVTTVTSLFAYCPTFLLIFLEMALSLMVLFAIIKLL